MMQQYKYKSDALGKLCFPDYENFSDVVKLMKTSFKN